LAPKLAHEPGSRLPIPAGISIPTGRPGNLGGHPKTGQQRAHSTASLFSQSAVVWQEPFLSVAFLGGITEKNARGRECAIPQARPNCAGIMPSVEARKGPAKPREPTAAGASCPAYEH